MKMNKLILVAAASLFMAFGPAHAVDTVTAVDSDPISDVDDCSLLSSAVTVRLSAGVHGGYLCDTGATSKTNGMLFFGTCHKTGSKADRSITCTGAGVPHADCKATETLTVSGRAAFMGSSDGGVIAGLNLNAESCDNTNITARVTSYQGEIAATIP